MTEQQLTARPEFRVKSDGSAMILEHLPFFSPQTGKEDRRGYTLGNLPTLFTPRGLVSFLTAHGTLTLPTNFCSLSTTVCLQWVSSTHRESLRPSPRGCCENPTPKRTHDSVSWTHTNTMLELVSLMSIIWVI
jgi:hypothetical protein